MHLLQPNECQFNKAILIFQGDCLFAKKKHLATICQLHS